MVGNTKKSFIIDASFVLSFLLDETNVEVESFFKKYAQGEINFIAPSLIKYEVGNGLRTKVMRKQLKKDEAEKLYDYFLGLEIQEENSDFNQILDLAIKKNLSFYDASYISLAKDLSLQILSLDRDLRKVKL